MSQWNDITGVTMRLDSDRDDAFERNRPYLIVMSGAHVGEMFRLEGSAVILGRGRRTNIRLVDEGISRQHAAVVARPEDGRYWVKDLDSRNGTFCNGKRIREQPLSDGDKIQIGRAIMLRFSYCDRFDESFLRLMHDSALRDALTRAFNKRYFTERLQSEVTFARRHKDPLSLLLMDLDHFKVINDTYGHVVGDHVLSAFSRAIHRSVRNEDVFARYGGEEFALISRAISLEDTRRLADRLRAVIEELEIDYHGNRIPLTMSVGVAALSQVSPQEPVDLVHAADRALYRAKTHGRNLVAVFDSELDARPMQETGPVLIPPGMGTAGPTDPTGSGEPR